MDPLFLTRALQSLQYVSLIASDKTMQHFIVQTEPPDQRGGIPPLSLLPMAVPLISWQHWHLGQFERITFLAGNHIKNNTITQWMVKLSEALEMFQKLSKQLSLVKKATIYTSQQFYSSPHPYSSWQPPGQLWRIQMGHGANIPKKVQRAFLNCR